MRSERLGTIAILVASVGYATIPILLKLALEAGAAIWPLIAWRFLIGAAAVWLFMLVARRQLPSRRRVPALVLLGILYAGNATAFLVGLQWVPAATASLVFFTYPAVVVVLSRVFLGEPLTRRRVLAAALALFGCLLTAGAGLHGGESRGIALILVATALLSATILISQPVLRNQPAAGGAAVVHTAIAAVSVLVALGMGGLALGGGTRAAVLTLLLGLVATALPVTLFLVGIKRIGPARAAIYSTVEPMITVGLAALVLGERISLGQLLGGLLIVAAVLGLAFEGLRARLPPGPAAGTG